MEIRDGHRPSRRHQDEAQPRPKVGPDDRNRARRFGVDLGRHRVTADPVVADPSDRVPALAERIDDLAAPLDERVGFLVELTELPEQHRLTGPDLLEDTAHRPAPAGTEDQRVDRRNAGHIRTLPRGWDTFGTAPPASPQPVGRGVAGCRTSATTCDRFPYAAARQGSNPTAGWNRVPVMRNAVPELADELAGRAVADRQASYADEVRRLLEAGFAVMGRTENLDPRVSDIVRTSGLSNQTFYRHFRGKDEFFLALLDDGRRRLVETIERRMRRATDDAGRVGAWIQAVYAQAQDPEAAAATRPFALNGERLAARFPDAAQRSQARLVAPLLAIVGPDDASAIYHLVMGSMHDALVTRRIPSRSEVDHVVDFALRGAHLGT